MTLLMILAGIAAGWAVNALAERLPQWSGHAPTRGGAAAPLELPAVVRALKSGGRGPRARRSAWRVALAAELGSAAFLAVAWQACGASQALALYAAAYLYLLLITLIDLKHRLVLNVLIYPAVLAVLAGHALAAGRLPPHVLVGGGMAFSIFFLTAWLKPGQVGFGDVKLATLIGAGLGFPAILWALLVGSGAAGVAIGLLVGKGASLKARLPYAPFLCLGAMVALLYTPHLMPI